jgi:hypothetical protein
MRFRITTATVLALLVLAAVAVEPASAAKPVTHAYKIQAQMFMSVDGSLVRFTGTLSVSSRIVGSGAQTRHKTTYEYDFVSLDGTIRATGQMHRDVRTGPKESKQYHHTYHMNFIQAGKGLVAQVRRHTHYVFNANGELVSLHTTFVS